VSEDRAEVAIVALVLLAAGGVMLAPVVGRHGADGLANLIAVGAALCGLAAFGAAGAVTLRSARSGRRGRPSEDDR
jgi:hypothetical protein